MARGRVITGVGRAVSAVDGDEITVQLGLRAGAVAYAGRSSDGPRTAIR